MYLYRAVDSDGNTLEFLLSPTRDAQAAKRFFMKAQHSTADSVPGAHPAEEQVAQPTAPANPTTPTPRVINVEKNAAYPKAEASLKAVGMLPASVERETWSNTSRTWWSKTTAFSNGWSSPGWASFPWKRQGEPCKAMKRCI